MSDEQVDGYWAEHRKAGQAKRAQNRDTSAKFLSGVKIFFESANNGAHLIVQGPEGKIDFWPGTGKWICRKWRKHGRGLKELVNYIRGK